MEHIEDSDEEDDYEGKKWCFSFSGKKDDYDSKMQEFLNFLPSFSYMLITRVKEEDEIDVQAALGLVIFIRSQTVETLRSFPVHWEILRNSEDSAILYFKSRGESEEFKLI